MTNLKGQDDGEDDRSLAGQIARTLSRRIVVGELAPGTPLRQDHVAGEFRASHVPVREAFRKLEAQGLVTGAPRRGVRVTLLNPAALLEITEMRAALEVLALVHAIPKLTEADLAEAQATLEAGETSDDIAVWEAANRRYHAALWRPCGMPRLLATLDDLNRAAARYLYATWKELDWQPRSDREHRALLAALRAGDGALACERLGDHIRDAGKALHARLTDVGASQA
ncbi:GntR family transcriptional regulator [Algihabitans albus]|uniref:GntR family transcriptional regulator n=1 Tax=Algihabitans albus TaxID=2164067 RepID=UPI000E5D67C0|nr:GntR family transcriptional regulator [Algihabitans albus]